MVKPDIEHIEKSVFLKKKKKAQSCKGLANMSYLNTMLITFTVSQREL